MIVTSNYLSVNRLTVVKRTSSHGGTGERCLRKETSHLQRLNVALAHQIASPSQTYQTSQCQAIIQLSQIRFLAVGHLHIFCREIAVGILNIFCRENAVGTLPGI